MSTEALGLITEELAAQAQRQELQGSQLTTVASRTEGIQKTLSRIETLLVQTLRDQAEAEDKEARRKVTSDERFERIERALKLRPA
jgi:hypothetical protein